MAEYWQFHSASGQSVASHDLDAAKAQAAEDYQAFIRSFDPTAAPVVEWRSMPGGRMHFLFADGAQTTWAVTPVTMFTPTFGSDT